jgi:hypothetical protein
MSGLTTAMVATTASTTATMPATTATAPTALIYLAAPKHVYATPRYDAALELIANRHPNSPLIHPRGLWRGSAHWRATFRDILVPVTDLYVLSDLDGYVGAGVYAEWDYLRDRVYVCCALLPDGRIADGLTLEVIDPDDWQLYALVHATPSGERWAAAPGAEAP